MKNVYLIFLLLCFSQSIQASQKRKVLIIGMAGVRSDALQKANTPTIDNVISNGFYSYASWHRGYTISAPAWATTMCGVEFNKHKVVDNTYAGNDFADYPYFPTRAKSCSPGLYCTQIVQWKEMSDNLTNDGWNQKVKVPYGDGASGVTAAKTQLVNPNLDVLFICFDEADIVGHSTGFSPDNAQYISAIETIDGYINQIITAVHNRPDYADEDWITLVTTDYGGIGTTHGTNTDQERMLWWVGQGNRLGTHKAPSDTDPGSVAIGNFDPVKGALNPAQYDIAVTALDHLLKGSSCNPTINPAWGLDGKSWLDSIHTDAPNGIADISADLPDVKVAPNPSSGLVTLWMENNTNQKVSFQLKNELGQDVSLDDDDAGIINKNKITIDFSNKPEGIYYVEILIGEKRVTKKIIHR